VVERLRVPDVIVAETRQRLALLGQFHLRQIVAGRTNVLMLQRQNLFHHQQQQQQPRV